jgi:DNA-binding NtrC family response regulator
MYHETERRYFQDLWNHFAGDVKQIAHQAGLTRSRVYSILSKYDIQ